MYANIRAEIADGGRAFIVCPIIEKSEVPSHKLMKAAVSERNRLHESGEPLSYVKIKQGKSQLPTAQLRQADGWLDGRTDRQTD